MNADLKASFAKDAAARHLAAKAFYEVNHDQVLRKALMAKMRSEHVPLQLGDYAFYWRTAETKHEVDRWRGPALICAIGPRVTEIGSLRPFVYWLAHGNSLVRVTPEHLRPEVPFKRAERLKTMPQTALAEPLQQRVLSALKPVRGPIRFLDLIGDPTSANASASSSTTPPPILSLNEAQAVQKMQIEDSDEKRAGSLADAKEAKEAKKRRREEKKEEESRSLEEPPRSEEPDQGEEKAEEPQVEAVREEEKTEVATEAVEEKSEESMRVEEPVEEENRGRARNVTDGRKKKDEEETSERQRSRGPIEWDERAKAFQSFNMARKLDGLPPETEEVFLRRLQAQQTDAGVDEELVAEAFNEKKLNEEERQQFSIAKDQALQVWIDNKAWRPVDESEAKEGEVIPAHFLMRWKPMKEGKKANARMIIQGFRHQDVLNSELERESPTLSMTGRMLIMVVAVYK